MATIQVAATPAELQVEKESTAVTGSPETTTEREPPMAAVPVSFSDVEEVGEIEEANKAENFAEDEKRQVTEDLEEDDDDDDDDDDDEEFSINHNAAPLENEKLPLDQEYEEDEDEDIDG